MSIQLETPRLILRALPRRPAVSARIQRLTILKRVAFSLIIAVLEIGYHRGGGRFHPLKGSKSTRYPLVAPASSTTR